MEKSKHLDFFLVVRIRNKGILLTMMRFVFLSISQSSTFAQTNQNLHFLQILLKILRKSRINLRGRCPPRPRHLETLQLGAVAKADQKVKIASISQFYQISSSWVRISLHTEFELPRLPASTTFWWGCCDCDCCDCDGVKTKSTPSLFY